MATLHELRWSDVWFLISLYYCSLNEQCRLRDIIAAADSFNHAIMNFEEMSSALVRLEEHRLITVEADPWRAGCTSEGRKIIEPLAKHSSLGRVWQETEKKLNAKPWVPKEPLPHPANSLRYPNFTEEDYEKEVVAYLEMVRMKRKT